MHYHVTATYPVLTLLPEGEPEQLRTTSWIAPPETDRADIVRLLHAIRATDYVLRVCRDDCIPEEV